MFTRHFAAPACAGCSLILIVLAPALAIEPPPLHDQRPGSTPVEYQVPTADPGLVVTPPATDAHELSAAQAAAINYAYGGGGFDYRGYDHCRAGCPQTIRKHAIPTNTRFYGGYYVGGGVPFQGEGPTLEEGTFGWDYFGILFQKRIVLNWTHGRRYQDGGGVYKTDGPKVEHE